MEKEPSCNSRKADAARVNGRRGGTKSPDISRWNALRHARNARLSILEGKHLPEYGEYAGFHAELVKSLSLSCVEDFIAVDKFITDAWRVRRSYRFELSETEKPDHGMQSPAMGNILRYANSADRQFAESHARVKEIRKRNRVVAAQPSQTVSVNAEAPDSVPIAYSPEDGGKREPAQSASPATPPSASADSSNANLGTPEEALHSAAAAEPAPPREDAPGANPTTAASAEQYGPDGGGAG